MVGKAPAYRVTFGAGSYLILVAWYGMIIKCGDRIPQTWRRHLIALSGVGGIAALFALGWMDKMSIMTEYFARADKFYSAFRDHLGICVVVLIASIIVGLPLGYLCYRGKIIDAVSMGFLNIARSVPSIALIMVMVTPLSLLKNIPFLKSLGVSSFGFTPVFCALFLYALFQIVNSLSGALKTIDENYIKTAKAMGMTDGMIMRQVQIPLVLPVLVAGIRVAIVSTFSAAALGTMVGYGGLGVFITMGSGSAIALDLILLGAVPIIIMIFCVNFVFGALSKWLERRSRGA
jgi:osmoprotectant transport system permease protein